MNGPLTVEPHLSGGPRIVFALLQIAKLERDAIYHVDASGPRRGHYMSFWVVIKRKLFAHRVARPNVPGIVHHAKNHSCEAWGGSRNLLSMQNALCALNENFQPDTPRRKADVLLNLREQPVREDHVRCILHLGDYHDINVCAGSFDHIDYIPIEKLGINAVGAECANLSAKI